MVLYIFFYSEYKKAKNYTHSLNKTQEIKELIYKI
jgi:hypothetical protein